MRNLIDKIRRKSNRTAVFFASASGAHKVDLVAGLSRDLVDSGLNAGDWVKAVAPVVGGGGGGKPDIAQAGGKQPENIQPALDAASDFIRAVGYVTIGFRSQVSMPAAPARYTKS